MHGVCECRGFHHDKVLLKNGSTFFVFLAGKDIIT